MPMDAASTPGGAPVGTAGADGPDAAGANPLSAPLTFRTVAPEEFARLRTLLKHARFDTATIRERTGCTLFEELARNGMPADSVPSDGLGALIELFVYGRELPATTMESLLPAELRGLLRRTGLVADSGDDATRLRAPLALYPAEGLFIVSDHWQRFTGTVSRDVVYPALTMNTREFVRALPATPCEALLDLGAGTGIAALAAASHRARNVWATDVAARATEVTAFNAALNGLDNVRALQGDLYAPVADLTFDRIVTHPPYAPAVGPGITYRDGGEDGEQITRGIVQGLADHLRPGGRLWCRCLLTDRKDAPVEQRVRRMIGDDAADFDVMVVAKAEISPVSHLQRGLTDGSLTAVAFEERLRGIRALDVESFVIGFLVIERHEAVRAPITVRRFMAPDVQPKAAIFDWLHAWESRALNPAFTGTLLAARPVLATGVTVRMVHRAGAEGLRAVGCEIATDRPFVFSMQGSPGLALLFERCDGSNSFEALRVEMASLGVIPEGLPLEEYLTLVRALVGGGVLEIAELPIPPAPPDDA